MKVLGRRKHNPDRKLLSINDMYGFGFLVGIGAEFQAERFHYYCGKKASEEQYICGFIDGKKVSPPANCPSQALSLNR
jgi:hypothetical protein